MPLWLSVGAGVEPVSNAIRLVLEALQISTHGNPVDAAIQCEMVGAIATKVIAHSASHVTCWRKRALIRIGYEPWPSMLGAGCLCFS